MFDAEAEVLYMRSWWRWNTSVNTNILVGKLKDLSEIPSGAFIDAFPANTAYVPVKQLECFAEALQKRLPKLPESPDQKSTGLGLETQ
jgi:hypothetical protein